MKKLMTIACLLMTGIAMSATPTAQVYDVVLKVKTTAAASATLDNKKNPLAVEVGDDARTVIYRKQTTATWKGIIWGCGCETINGKWERVHTECEEEPIELDTVKGCILWDVKTKVPVYIGCFSDLADASTVPGKSFGWNFIHAINKDGKQVEGSWVMEQQGNACDESGVLFSFAGSGFGTSNLILENGMPTCISYIKTISGNFSGWMKAPTYSNQEGWSGCRCCGVPVPASCDFGEAWDWCNWSYVCDCDSETSEWMDYTAAYGTWQIKYNAGLSKKLAAVVKPAGEHISICDAYDFKGLPYVETAIHEAEAKVRGELSECEELGYEVFEAKSDVKIAQDKVDSVSTEKLYAEVEDAKSNLYLANSNLLVKTTAFTQAAYEYADATNEYNKTSNTLATASWKIEYVNSSSKPATKRGTGLDSFDDMIDELEHFTVSKYKFNDYTIYPTKYSVAKKYVSDNNENLAALKKTVDDKFATYELAEAEKKAAEYVKELCETNLKTAELRYADRGNLQYVANQELFNAQRRLAIVEAAYDAAGCN